MCDRWRRRLTALLMALGLTLGPILVSAATTAAKEETVLLISAAGDCTIGSDPFRGGTLPQVLRENGGDLSYFFRNVAPYFLQDDLTIVNLEGPLTDSDDAQEKEFRFRGDPAWAEALPLGGIEVANLANNHIRDFGAQGYADTKEALRAVGVGYCDEEEAYIVELKGLRVGCLGYRASSAGRMKEEVAALKGQCDLVLVSLHAGEEGAEAPIDAQITLARRAIDSGADVVLGDHPHVVQGIEAYRDGYIAYCLGNFCFGGNRNPKDKDSMILQIYAGFTDGQRTSLRLRVVPCSISSVSNTNNYQPTPLSGAEAARVLAKLQARSDLLDGGLRLNKQLPAPRLKAYLAIRGAVGLWPKVVTAASAQ